ncbi:regulator of G-protein signaling 22-like [Pungitius pungitius]|uniref:regulator of G-protein signaling 22-like n=1 Tax=Pungitius pungitius TaxID=134920 RepID=UPI002E13A4BD
MCALVSPEFTDLTADNFENSLAADDVLAHYFNYFLTLPCFAETVLYHPETGRFQVMDPAPQFVSTRVPSVLRCSKPRPLAGATTRPGDNRYTIYVSMYLVVKMNRKSRM